MLQAAGGGGARTGGFGLCWAVPGPVCHSGCGEQRMLGRKALVGDTHSGDGGQSQGKALTPAPRDGFGGREGGITYVVEVFPLLCPFPVGEPVVDHLLLPRPVHRCKASAGVGVSPPAAPLSLGQCVFPSVPPKPRHTGDATTHQRVAGARGAPGGRGDGRRRGNGAPWPCPPGGSAGGEGERRGGGCPSPLGG